MKALNIKHQAVDRLISQYVILQEAETPEEAIESVKDFLTKTGR
jgi:hypothetical protein